MIHNKWCTPGLNARSFSLHGIYNDFPENLFADDLKLESSSLIELQIDFSSPIKWSEENQLEFMFMKKNFNETYQFSKVQYDYLVLYMGENNIYLTRNSTRNLGVRVTPNLTWTILISIRKANINAMLRLHRYPPKILNPYREVQNVTHLLFNGT